QVVAEILRVRERARGRQHAELFAVGADEAHRRDADLFVDPQFGRGYRADSAIRRGTPLAMGTSTRKRISPAQQRLKPGADVRPFGPRDRVHDARAYPTIGHEPIVA